MFPQTGLPGVISELNAFGISHSYGNTVAFLWVFKRDHSIHECEEKREKGNECMLTREQPFQIDSSILDCR